MKFKILGWTLTVSCLICLAGCGTTPASSVATVPETTGQPFGASAIDTAPVQAAETTTLPETSFAEAMPPENQIPDETQSAEEPAGPEAVDYTPQAVIAAIICDAVDTLPYAPEDPMYLWRSVGYLAGQIGIDGDLIQQEGDFGKITPETARLFACAIAPDFSGDLPSVSEEDPLISAGDDGSYLINMLDQGELTLEMTENRFSATDGPVTEDAEFFRDGQSLGIYTVTLVPYTGLEDGALFRYSIQDISPK